jgi:iron complex transport system substrate-binding protein
MADEIGEIRRHSAAFGSRPRVMEYDPSGYTAGKDTLIDQMLGVVGARNLAAENGIEGSTRISAEAVALWQPDFLIAGAARGNFDLVRRSMMSDPAIANTPAGRSGRIIVIDDRFLICVSQYIVYGMAEIAKGLYGTAPG